MVACTFYHNLLPAENALTFNEMLKESAVMILKLAKTKKKRLHAKFMLTF